MSKEKFVAKIGGFTVMVRKEKFGGLLGIGARYLLVDDEGYNVLKLINQVDYQSALNYVVKIKNLSREDAEKSLKEFMNNLEEALQFSLGKLYEARSTAKP